MIRGRKVAGIIGGMGPAATADLFTKIVAMTEAVRDQEHIHILIDNNTDIPDRTAAILQGVGDPLTPMIESGRRLVAQGADFLLVPCNTAHHYWQPLSEAMEVPVLNMPRLALEECRRQGLGCVGLLATEGCVTSGVYSRVFAGSGVELLCPEGELQQALMHIIYDEVKAGLPAHPEALHPYLKEMERRGAGAFLLACTELPIAFAGDGAFRYMDVTGLLAAEAIRQAGGKVRE